ncbi:hypothetical protein [uncultured Chryseobacterium sp.]|uniref:hypothetical protein n=1 Tax=uncultured Chryseobacterium sp. TaxID=259322 RepID=UPI0025F62256|nr:hypothetical protein [uncultured Chryseobacterium sp.]
MSKRTIPQLKEYFKAAKRPTEGQFGNLLDSYIHYTKNLNSDFTDLNFSFPNNESNKAIDVLFGNNYVNGFVTIEIVGSFAHQSSVGMIKKQFQIGANPDNGVWYGTTSRIVEAEGSILDNIYIGDFEWDPVINQYKITIFHTVSSGNPYNVKVSQQSVGELVVDKVSLSGFYNRPISGQGRHFVNYNQNVGIGTKVPEARLHVNSAFSTPNQYGSLMLGDATNPNLRMGSNAQYSWIQSHAGAPLQVNPIGNNTVFNRDGGNVGIGTDNPQSQLHLQFLNSEPKSIQFVQFTNYVNTMNAAIRYTWYNEYCDVGIVRGGSTDISAYAIKFNGNEKARFAANGNAAFQGKVEAKDFVVSASPTADFVFAQDYNLRGINDLEKFISEKQHLPEIPSAKEMTESGVTVGEFQIKLLQKIEELTLYAIAQHKELEQLKSKINNTNA